jgi:hypothetical protein
MEVWVFCRRVDVLLTYEHEGMKAWRCGCVDAWIWSTWMLTYPVVKVCRHGGIEVSRYCK